jgi:hypothetical protein
MNDLHKFQDDGFIPKEVFIEARETRMNTRQSLVTVTGLKTPERCFDCFTHGIMCCPHINKESTNDQTQS